MERKATSVLASGSNCLVTRALETCNHHLLTAMSSIEPLQSIILDLPPCCIESYPDNPQYAVIGTYNLEKQDGEQRAEEGQRKSQQRNGSLILIKITADEVYATQRVICLVDFADFVVSWFKLFPRPLQF